MRPSRWVTLALIVMAVAGVLFARYCRGDVREAIVVGEGRVVVTNLTGTTWSDVEIWLNDYYRVQTERLLPDQRLEVALDVFVAGYGQRFQPHRQEAKGLELTARDEKGGQIRLTWGSGRRR